MIARRGLRIGYLAQQDRFEAAREGWTVRDLRARLDDEQASHLAAMLDLDGNLLEVNQRFLEASGFRRSDVLGRPLWVCGWWNREPELMERVRASVLGAARGETSRTVSSYFVADGSERFVDLVLSPVKSSASSPSC